DRDHRLVREALEECDLCVGERSNLRPTHRDRADGDTLSEERRREEGADPGQALTLPYLRELRLHSLGKILDMDRLAVDDGTTVQCGPRDGDPLSDLPRSTRGPVVRDELEGVAIHAKYRGIRRATESCRTLEHDLHHRLEIGRRAGDDAQNLRCRGLL